MTDRERAREMLTAWNKRFYGTKSLPQEDEFVAIIASALAAVRAETVEQCAKIPDALAATWRNVALTGTPVYPHLSDPRPEMEIMALRYAELAAAIRSLKTGDTNVPEVHACDHGHYSFAKHGRRCTCGALLTDFGD